MLLALWSLLWQIKGQTKTASLDAQIGPQQGDSVTSFGSLQHSAARRPRAVVLRGRGRLVAPKLSAAAQATVAAVPTGSFPQPPSAQRYDFAVYAQPSATFPAAALPPIGSFVQPQPARPYDFAVYAQRPSTFPAAFVPTVVFAQAYAPAPYDFTVYRQRGGQICWGATRSQITASLDALVVVAPPKGSFVQAHPIPAYDRAAYQSIRQLCWGQATHTATAALDAIIGAVAFDAVPAGGFVQPYPTPVYSFAPYEQPAVYVPTTTRAVAAFADGLLEATLRLNASLDAQIGVEIVEPPPPVVVGGGGLIGDYVVKRKRRPKKAPMGFGADPAEAKVARAIKQAILEGKIGIEEGAALADLVDDDDELMLILALLEEL